MKILMKNCRVSLILGALLVGLFASGTSLAQTTCQGKACFAPYGTPKPQSFTRPSVNKPAPSARDLTICKYGCISRLEYCKKLSLNALQQQRNATCKSPERDQQYNSCNRTCDKMYR